MTIAIMITTWLLFGGMALGFALGSELHVADHKKVVNAELLVAGAANEHDALRALICLTRRRSPSHHDWSMIRHLGALIAASSLLVACSSGNDGTLSDDGREPELVFGGAADNPDGNGPYRATLFFDQGYMLIEVLTDELVHVEYGAGQGPGPNPQIYASPMVRPQSYPGPRMLSFDGAKVLQTEALRLEMDGYGCVAVTDRAEDEYRTKICPVRLRDPQKGLSIDPSRMRNAYGLGQYFRKLGTANGDWVEHGGFATDGEYGNHFRDFWGGANGQIQFPMLYAAGEGNDCFGLFLDNVYKQDWDFQSDSWWQMRTSGDQLRFYLVGGRDLAAVRSNYMDLVGRPLVPPRKAFGMWVSEFGFDNWEEIDGKLSVMRKGGFPIDGFALDVQWFGGAQENSPDSAMGGLAWDPVNFPDVRDRLRAYTEDHIGFINIEESYVSRNQPSYGEMDTRGGLVRHCEKDTPVDFVAWMGDTGMIDWSNAEAAAWWHDNLRQPNIIDLGVVAHWTDLGEPERFDPAGCYQGVEPWKTRHADIHNIFNLLWHRSIYEGYQRNHASSNQRPFMLSRAGAPGIQRFGAGMWSGDIASRLDVLATHMNASLHMSFAGIDYYSADTGGFWRRALAGDTAVSNDGAKSMDEMFTQWVANAAWFDIPFRIHTFNCGFDWFQEPGCPYEVSPAILGHAASNLANIRQRYELIPYYYSLAHRANQAGEAVIAPVVMHFQSDPETRQMGHQRMIGASLLVGVVASHGQSERPVYLPAGTWVDYHSHDIIESTGEWTVPMPLWKAGVFRLPAFIRAGAIIPRMVVDEATKDAFGHRQDGTVRDELVLLIVPDQVKTEFTVYEDDGTTVAKYDSRGPRYEVMSTQITQETTQDDVTVTIAASEGTFAGGPSQRANVLELVLMRPVESVKVNGKSIPPVDGVSALDTVDSGWTLAGPRTVMVKTGRLGTDIDKTIRLTLGGRN